MLRTMSLLGHVYSSYTDFGKPDDDLANRTYEVQGKNATLNEYNVALGLDNLGFEYVFQVNLFGGRMELGGVVVDFVVMTVPLPTPLWVHGEFWHTGEAREKDLLQQAQVEAEMGSEMLPPIELWGYQTATPELALMWLRRYL